MTYTECYRRARDTLRRAGVESPAFDAMCLFEKAFGLDRAGLAVHGPQEAPPAGAQALEAWAARRAAHEPLQYLLGEWEFYGRRFAVGEGVLIPRPETELLVDAAKEALGGRLPPGGCLLDLCAGTGAVGISLAALFPQARVLCLERYPGALRYLRENLRRAGLANASAVEGDAFAPPQGLPPLCALVSNPPYVRRGELPRLQEEVRREPATALDGGEGGLAFYRAIASLWMPRLLPGGVLAVETGEDQAAQVAALFAAHGLCGAQVREDAAGLPRVVCGRMPEEPPGMGKNS